MNNKDMLEQLYIQKNHIIKNNKDDDNYDEQLKDIEDKIKNLEYQNNYDNLKNTSKHVLDRKLYTYKGPIYSFDTIIGNSDLHRTYAKSEKQAINNICHQIKKSLKKEENTSIHIDKKYLQVKE